MNFKRRKGFALIWVVLIGALIFVGIVGLTLRIVPENMITVARTHTQRALSVAEEGTNQVLFDLRNYKNNVFDPNSIIPNATAIHYLETGDILSLINTYSNGVIIDPIKGTYITNPSPPSDESFETRYQAKIKVISNTYSDEGGVRTGTLNVSLYTLGTALNRANENVLARKAIKTGFLVDYKKITPQPGWEDGTTSPVFDYALLSGENITFKGSAQTVTGNIHAIGIVDLGNAQNQVRVGGGGNAEAEDKIQGAGVVTGLPLSGSPPSPKITFPEINIVSYKALADDFRDGTIPYDGTETASGFPNTNNLFLKPAIQAYLGAPGTSSTVGGIQDFYTNLMAGTGEFSVAQVKDPDALKTLQDNVKAAVFYVDADSPLNGGNGDGKIQSNEEIKINGNYSFQGTIVINGTLTLNGNATIGDVNTQGGSAILVNGDIDTSKLNGTAQLYGAYYATGSITGKGTFDCEGSIVTKGTIALNGNYSVTYVPINNPNLGITTPGHETPPTGETSYSITSAASETSSYSWKEISYEAFQNGN
jgi:hypothetical protein